MAKVFKYVLDFSTNSAKAVNEITGVSGAIKGVAAAAGALFAVDAVKDFLISSKQAYQESAMAEAALLTALKGRKSVQMELINQASDLQGKTLFDDDETVRAASLVAAFVKEEQQIKRLIPVIQDFATAKQMDLAGAADLVTKTLASETNALGRYGIQIEGAAGSTDRLDQIVQKLTDHFGGQAQAAAEASDGTVMLANNFENLKEQIGGAIVESGWYNNLLGEMSKSVTILSSDLSFWQKINPFQSQEKTYQKAVDAIKEVQAAEIEAQRAAEKAARDNETTEQFMARVDAMNAETSASKKSTLTYGDIIKKISEKNIALKETDVSQTGTIRSIYAEIAALEKQKAAFEALATVKKPVERDTTSYETISTRQDFSLTGNPEDALNLKPTLNLEEMQKNMPLYQSLMASMGEEQELAIEKQRLFADAFQQGFSAIGQSVVEGLGLAEDGFQGFLGVLLSSVIQAIAAHEAQAIAAAIVGAEESGAGTGPLAVFTTPVFLATMIGGVLSAFAAIPKFAAGGIAYGPTLGLFGEYPGASSNPEIIAPLSDLEEMIAPAGGGTVILQPGIDMDGDRLRVFLTRMENKAYKRT